MVNGAQSVITGLIERQARWLANKWDIDDVIKYWIMSSKYSYVASWLKLADVADQCS